jgi:hypothetical protein
MSSGFLKQYEEYFSVNLTYRECTEGMCVSAARVSEPYQTKILRSEGENFILTSLGVEVKVHIVVASESGADRVISVVLGSLSTPRQGCVGGCAPDEAFSFYRLPALRAAPLDLSPIVEV